MRMVWKGEDLGEWRGAPSIPEARLIKKMTGLLPKAFNNAVGDMDPDAWAALVKILLKRKGVDVRLEEIDGDFDDLDFQYSEQEKQAQADAKAETINPVIRGILADLGVDVDDDQIHKVVMERLLSAEEDEGKDHAPSTLPTSGPATTSTI